MQPPTSGSIPLQEYRRDIPPGWAPGDASYPLRVFFEKLKLWYRIANVEDEAIGPLIAGRLYGRASTIAMGLRVPRPDGQIDVGDAALVRLAVDEVRDPATNQVIQQHIPSGVQFLVNSLRAAFGQQDQDLATNSLDRFFTLTRSKLSLAEYAVEFDSRYDEAHDRAGLQLNDVGKFYLWFKNSGLPSKTVDDIKLQVAGDYTRFTDARALALRISPNRREADETQILYGENGGDPDGYEDYYQDQDWWPEGYDAEDAWWAGYEIEEEGEWVFEEYYDENYYEEHAAPDDAWHDEGQDQKPPDGAASSAEDHEAYYKGKSKGKNDGCFNCGSKWHMVRDCPLGNKGKGKGQHYQGPWKGRAKGAWRWKPGKGKGKKGKGYGKRFGKGKGYGKRNYYTDEWSKPRGSLGITEGIPDASTPMDLKDGVTVFHEQKSKPEKFVIHTSSEEEDFKKANKTSSNKPPEYTSASYEHYEKKLTMSFAVFHERKEDMQLSYHTVHGKERRGLLIDPGAASGLIGSETLRTLSESCMIGEMELNHDKVTPVSGISGGSEATLGEVTLTMATGGQPIRYTAEVLGGEGSLCPALVGNPTLRRMGASILTDWFQNGDGLLVLNSKDDLEEEVNHVRFLRILLTDSGHYILPCDGVKDEKVPKETKHEAIAFFQKVTEISAKIWPDVQPRVRHCFHAQTAAEDDRGENNVSGKLDRCSELVSSTCEVSCEKRDPQDGPDGNAVTKQKEAQAHERKEVRFAENEQSNAMESKKEIIHFEEKISQPAQTEKKDSDYDVSQRPAILVDQSSCKPNDNGNTAENSNHLIKDEHSAGSAILDPATPNEDDVQYMDEKKVFPCYVKDMIPETADQSKLKRRYKAIPEEFYSKSGMTPVTPENFRSWFGKMKGRGLRWHFWELFSGSGRLSLTLLLAGLMIGFPVDYRYGWDIGDAMHRNMLYEAYQEFKPGVLHCSPDCAPWSISASTKDPDEKLADRIHDRPSLQFCQDLCTEQAQKNRGYNVEQPWSSQMWQELPECPLRLNRIKGNKMRQRIDQCMHGARDEHRNPFMKATGFGSNMRWDHTALRCSGHGGVDHAHLQGTGPGGLSRTSMAAVYPFGYVQSDEARHHPVPQQEPLVTQLEDLAHRVLCSDAHSLL